MKNNSNYLSILKEIGTSYPCNETIKGWKENGKNVIGWLCTYVPEEMIYAADILPIRIMGDESINIGESEAYLYSNTCSLARNCLQLGLNRDYDFLDGVVTGTTCDQIRRLCEVWERYITPSFTHIIGIPHKITERSTSFFRHEIGEFKEKLEEFSGKEISNESLIGAIGVYNKTRELLRSLYNLRKANPPPITGSEIQTIVNSSTRMPRDDYNMLLENVIDEIAARKNIEDGKARIMLSGSPLDSPAFIKEIEDLGTVVVADELCTGSNYFWDMVETDLDPLDALAKRYLSHAPCARIRPSTKRIDYLLNMIKSFHVDGVILINIKFCDLYAYDHVLIRNELDKNGIQVLEIEREYQSGGAGQIKTRVQAFIEMLGG